MIARDFETFSHLVKVLGYNFPLQFQKVLFQCDILVFMISFIPKIKEGYFVFPHLWSGRHWYKSHKLLKWRSHQRQRQSLWRICHRCLGRKEQL